MSKGLRLHTTQCVLGPPTSAVTTHTIKGLSEKVHIIRCCGFTKALLCIAVMPPLHRSELLVCIQRDQVLVVWFGRSDHHLVLRRSLSGTVAASEHRIVSRRGHG